MSLITVGYFLTRINSDHDTKCEPWFISVIKCYAKKVRITRTSTINKEEQKRMSMYNVKTIKSQGLILKHLTLFAPLFQCRAFQKLKFKQLSWEIPMDFLSRLYQRPRSPFKLQCCIPAIYTNFSLPQLLRRFLRMNVYKNKVMRTMKTTE